MRLHSILSILFRRNETETIRRRGRKRDAGSVSQERESNPGDGDEADIFLSCFFSSIDIRDDIIIVMAIHASFTDTRI